MQDLLSREAKEIKRRMMRLACGWMWLLFQVCWALEGPQTVTGPTGGSVSVECQYRRGYTESVKFWCKEVGLRQCSNVHKIQTTGSEAEVKRNRISIKDNHALRTFMVTMENLTNGDSGTYLCGVEETQRYDIWHPVEVKVTTDLLGQDLTPSDLTTTDFPSPNPSGNKGHSTEVTGNPGPTTMVFERTQTSNIHVMLLVFFKIPIFLAMIVAVVCVHIWDWRERISKVPATRASRGCFSQLIVRRTSVSVQCEYDQQYTRNKKYWCRGPGNSCHKIVETSGASDRPETAGSVSIADNHTLRRFTVTMEDMSEKDVAVYSCGVTLPGREDWTAPVNITVIPIKPDHPGHTEPSNVSFPKLDFVRCEVMAELPGKSELHFTSTHCEDGRRSMRALSLLVWMLIPGCATSPVTSNQDWSGFLGRSLSGDCQYDQGYVGFKKYWCRGADWGSCETVVKTTGSEAEVKDGRTSIKDNRTLLEFTVRLDNLTQQDTGIYWCAIQKAGSDPTFRVNITVLPVQIFDLNVTPEENLATTEKPGERSSTTEQPDLDPTMETTTDVERSILSPVPTNATLWTLGNSERELTHEPAASGEVNHTFQQLDEQNSEDVEDAASPGLGAVSRGASWRSCEAVVKTTGSEAEVKAGRTSIKDNQALAEFTVRLDNLTPQDAGIYWCAIEKIGVDLKSLVTITVLPAPATPSEEGSTEQALSTHPPSTESDTDKKVEKGRVSIEDKREYSFFQVTMDNLRLDDSGTYQCGIENELSNIRYEVIVNVSTAYRSKPEEKSVTTEPPDPDLPEETDGTSPTQKSDALMHQWEEMVKHYPQRNKWFSSLQFQPFCALPDLNRLENAHLPVCGKEGRSAGARSQFLTCKAGLRKEEQEADCWTLIGPPAQHLYTGSSLSVVCHYEKRYQDYTKFWCKGRQYLPTCDRSFIIRSDTDKKVEKGRVSIEDKRKYSFFKVTMDNLRLDDSGIYQCGIEDGLINIRLEVIVNVSTGKEVTGYSTAGAPRENLVPDHPTSANGMGLYSNAEINPESNGERVHSQRKASEKRNEVAYATLIISDLQQEAIYANVDPTPSPGLPQTQDVFYTENKAQHSHILVKLQNETKQILFVMPKYRHSICWKQEDAEAYMVESVYLYHQVQGRRLAMKVCLN
ncbi:hypothetical protein lerEdw1_017818 [Lerista edwardsae]|nr:hypothetical protein lerEdw1_017818 [Lerista edwardsae]